MPDSRWCSTRSATAAITWGTHAPLGSSAVRQAASSTALPESSPRLAASSSPAEFIQRLVPEYAANTTGLTTPSASALRYEYSKSASLVSSPGDDGT